MLTREKQDKLRLYGQESEGRGLGSHPVPTKISQLSSFELSFEDYSHNLVMVQTLYSHKSFVLCLVSHITCDRCAWIDSEYRIDIIRK